ncbi:hypothetical protein GCM10009560_76640 [Nonomuraea longicatena]|uniref:Aminoglycoside phosphotransferase domain-containing protein n=1 Tax=Nonomuraea longicatena TaxID=83682 RepID=A0ABP4BS18_9ACTN
MPQPIGVNGWHATVWEYIPQPVGATPSPEDLRALVRDLHALPKPPRTPPEADLLGTPRADLDSHDPEASPVSPRQRAWLLGECDRVERSLLELTADLAQGLIHGDAHVGNLFGAPGGWRLGDWDSVGFGPLVQDAVPAMMGHHRFGRPRDRWLRFCRGYGLDPEIETTAAARLLRSARELRSLAAYIRAADHPAVHAELRRRLRSLMSYERHVWRPV